MELIKIYLILSVIAIFVSAEICNPDLIKTNQFLICQQQPDCSITYGTTFEEFQKNLDKIRIYKKRKAGGQDAEIYFQFIENLACLWNQTTNNISIGQDFEFSTKGYWLLIKELEDCNHGEKFNFLKIKCELVNFNSNSNFIFNNSGCFTINVFSLVIFLFIFAMFFLIYYKQVFVIQRLLNTKLRQKKLK